jgi:hypothetical protein
MNMSENSLKMSDVRTLFTEPTHRKLVLTDAAAKRVSDMLGLDAPGEIHLIVVEPETAEAKPAAEGQPAAAGQPADTPPQP